MKRPFPLNLTALSVALLLASATSSATTKHRAVFELTSDDPQVWDSVLNNVDNLRKAIEGVTVAVVAHGKGLSMLTRDGSGPVRERMQEASGRGVVFAACENTMAKQDVTRQDLVPFAKTVDSGVAEVVRLQTTGWSYVRSGP